MHEYKSITTKKKEILMLKTMVNEKKKRFGCNKFALLYCILVFGHFVCWRLMFFI